MKDFLLDKDSHYILKIISLLNAAPNHELSLSDLETELGLAKQTVKSYFNKLLDYCQTQGLNTFSVDANHFKMVPGTAFNLYKLHHSLIQKSTKYQMSYRIFSDTTTTFTSLHQDLGISRSKCSVHIKQINDYLAPYGCHINFLQRNPMHGKEHQIRFVYHNLFWGLDLEEIIQKSPSLEAVSQLLLDFVPSLDYTTFLRIKLSFYIFQVNTRHGFFLPPEEDVFATPDSPYVTYDEFFDKVEAIGFLDTCPDFETKQREGRYLYFIFCRANLISLETWQTTGFQINRSLSLEVHDLITQFQNSITFRLSTEELNYLSYNLTLMNQEAAIFTGRNKVFDLGETAALLHRATAQTFEFINTFIQDIRDHNPNIQKLILNFPNLYYHYIVLLKNILKKHMAPLKILVQTNSSPIHREMLISQIRDASPVPVIVYTFNQLKGKKPDAIISNWMPENKYADVPFFSTSLFYSDWNKTDLDHFLNQLSDRKNNFCRLND
ncbi:helix-turn-helix domain-containing protein [Lactococcus reticulitermitis]|uniref:Mga helix-turn-helix domain-containing protein n=1 Tax=Pseudolactococcus reticulitermitis TaxID=2025039 RepID=A0A224XD76_9LACT|nr:helix-turn-helix domain-containing protein [Lactococcus reticulitermitis]GAX47862.1 hypothetical protein RsY01_1466 [Lactococcus reticulitermitis]